MQTQLLGAAGPRVSRIAFGCMTLGGSWDDTPLDAQVRRRAELAVETALECGVTLFDHADIYCRGKSESVFGSMLREKPGLRERIVLQSKCGIVSPARGSTEPARYDFSREHILASVDAILTRLQVDRLDVLLLHRPDPLAEPEEIAAAFDQLFRAGKVRTFGVSNHTASQIQLLSRYIEQPLVANQVQLGLGHCALIDQGITFNQTTPEAETAGTLEFCRLKNITLQAFGSLSKGYLCGRPIPADHPQGARLREAARVVAAFAAERGVLPETVALAWLLRHPARIQPVVGTLDPERLRAACRADALELSRVEWYRLYTAGRGDEVP